MLTHPCGCSLLLLAMRASYTLNVPTRNNRLRLHDAPQVLHHCRLVASYSLSRHCGLVAWRRSPAGVIAATVHDGECGCVAPGRDCGPVGRATTFPRMSPLMSHWTMKTMRMSSPQACACAPLLLTSHPHNEQNHYYYYYYYYHYYYYYYYYYCTL